MSRYAIPSACRGSRTVTNWSNHAHRMKTRMENLWSAVSLPIVGTPVYRLAHKTSSHKGHLSTLAADPPRKLDPAEVGYRKPIFFVTTVERI